MRPSYVGGGPGGSAQGSGSGGGGSGGGGGGGTGGDRRCATKSSASCHVVAGVRCAAPPPSHATANTSAAVAAETSPGCAPPRPSAPWHALQRCAQSAAPRDASPAPAPSTRTDTLSSGAPSASPSSS